MKTFREWQHPQLANTEVPTPQMQFDEHFMEIFFISCQV